MSDVLVGLFVCFNTSCGRTAKALARLRGCAGSIEPPLVAYVISIILSWASSFNNLVKQVLPTRTGQDIRTWHNGWIDGNHSWCHFRILVSADMLYFSCHCCQAGISLCSWHQSTKRKFVSAVIPKLASQNSKHNGTGLMYNLWA